MTHLIVGGTSGLGRELANRIIGSGGPVLVTGREDRGGVPMFYLDIDETTEYLKDDLDDLVFNNGPFKTVVYNPGYFQYGRIDDLTDHNILKMGNVGLIACALLMRRVMTNQDSLPLFIVVTSTSQFIPREFEPMYTAVKSGLAMFAHSLSRDQRISKTLVVAPAGMKTRFWRDTDQDTTSFLDESWVADQIDILLTEQYRYRYAQIHRNPPSVKIIETE